MRKETFAISAILAATVSLPDTAAAHGRLPEVTRISFGPDGTLLARASFGLLVSHDDGAAWDLVCAGAIGFGVNEDPVYAGSRDGAFVATTAGGLVVSRDRACTWADAPGAEALPFLDVTSDGAVALSSRYAGSDGSASRYESRIWRGGRAVGAPLDPSVVPHSFAVLGPRIDVAALRFGGGSKAALVLSSIDDGATWNEIAVALEPDEDGIAAVASDDARVVLRTRSLKGGSRLLVRDRESSAVRTVYRAPYGLTGVALSADHAEVWVAAGKAGIEHARTDDFVFERLAALDARCLAVDARGVWACADDHEGGFTIGLSTDGGRSFAPRLRMCEIRGNVACASGCAGEWERESRELGCEELKKETTTAAPIARDVSPALGPTPSSESGCSFAGHGASAPSAFVALLLALLTIGRRVCSIHGGTELRDDRAPHTAHLRRCAVDDRG